MQEIAPKPEIHEGTPDAYIPTEARPPGIVTDMQQLINLRERTEGDQDQDRLAFIDREMAREQEFFGIDLQSNPDEFFAAREQYFGQWEQSLNERFPTVKEKVVDSFASFLASQDVGAQIGLQELFQQRLAGVDKVFVSDPLYASNLGDFMGDSRTVRINAIVLMRIDRGERAEGGYLDDIVLAHELGHGMLVASRTDNAVDAMFLSGSIPSQNGLTTVHLPNEEKPVGRARELNAHGTWLNEAGLEDLRSQAMQTEQCGYKHAVALLRTLKDMDSGLEDALLIGMLDPGHKGAAIGRIEEQVGPLGVEAIEEDLQRLPIGPDREPTKDEVFARFNNISNLFPIEQRDQALKTMKAHWENLAEADREQVSTNV